MTGANGFVGRAALRAILEAGHEPVPLVRRPCALPGESLVGDLSATTDWRAALAGCHSVIHLAARVHVMKDGAMDPLALYRQVNRDGAIRLAQEAQACGVKRMVFVSTAKVLGEFSPAGRPFLENDRLAPADPYAVAKAEAETALAGLARESGLELAIVRPPLVYGPGVGANFRSMMTWVRRGVPLPLGALDNRRSLVGVRNLADLLVRCCLHPAAAGGIFHATDHEDVSTADLLRRLAREMGRPSRLTPAPPALLNYVLRICGAGAIAQRLCADFQLDCARTMTNLDWRPPATLDEELQRTVQAFLAPP
ncbi:MAG: NAD-dependent epimerase/dehydratase family protein [Beijerinckiaceae bacterium]